MVFPPRYAFRDLGLTAGFAAILLTGGATTEAAAQAKLEAHYRATLSGLPIGSGSWTVDLADDRYTMAASGHASGVFRIFASGSGGGAVTGSLHGGRAVPVSYASAVRTKHKTDEVKMALTGGAVKNLSIEPPFEPGPGHVPLTEAHKRGVLDPISAGVLPRAGGDTLGPESCQRTVAVFDGRMRFDAALSFKRMERVRSEKGYEGPAIVCAIAYHPLGGHETEKFAIKFLRENRDMEVWYVPIAGTRFLAVYRISIPTMLGPATLYATRFVVTVKSARATARTQ